LFSRALHITLTA